MKALPALLLIVSAAAQGDECLSYSRKITLSGVLSQRTFPEQPNYKSIANGDAAATHFFISPSKPQCVAEGTNKDGLEPAESKVERFQLSFSGDAKSAYDSLRPYVGKQMACVGSLFHAITGHHHSLVLLGEAKCSGALNKPLNAGAERRRVR